MKLIIGGIALVAIIAVIAACNQKPALTESQALIKAAIEKHGGKKYDKAAISFVFRDKTYSFKNDNGLFEYTLEKVVKEQTYHDTLNNDGFVRYIDGVKQDLSEEDAVKYGNSIASVVYFAQLPYKLEDPAVVSEYLGTNTIKGKDYEVVKVVFREEGGGADHEDIYYYWFDKETNQMDYLAYKFPTDYKGVRFRSAYNSRVVDGMIFQDYINYKAPYEMDMDSLAIYFENDELEELSKIELEKVTPL